MAIDQLGSVQNRLEQAISNLEADIENATASRPDSGRGLCRGDIKMTRLQILVKVARPC